MMKTPLKIQSVTFFIYQFLSSYRVHVEKRRAMALMETLRGLFDVFFFSEIDG